MKQTLNPGVARVHKSLHYPLDVFLTCVRWYVAYPLSFVRKGAVSSLKCNTSN